MLKAKQFILFLDRDGTVIFDRGYGASPVEVELMPGVADALADVIAVGARVCIVTNQSAIGRDLTDRSTVDGVNAKMIELLALQEVEITDIRICPHTPEDHCRCRKPNPGMLQDGAEIMGLSTVDSFMVGDRESDVDAGRSVGAYTVLLSDLEVVESHADHVAISVVEALDHIAERVRDQSEEQ